MFSWVPTLLKSPSYQLPHYSPSVLASTAPRVRGSPSNVGAATGECTADASAAGREKSPHGPPPRSLKVATFFLEEWIIQVPVMYRYIYIYIYMCVAILKLKMKNMET